ncbi:MAG: hypothetical protein LBT60_06950 [Oscillospiraceae bacterium]|jgi:hypothetical protein|nr:hypothetical protein [Oscillospiraceae bacterium]
MKHIFSYRIPAILLAAILCLSPLSGCDGADGGALTGDEIYKELDYLISNPTLSSELTGSFTFTAKTLGDPEELFVAEQDAVLIYACIARNYAYEFYLDVTDLDRESLPTADTLVRVTGTLDGSLYWESDGEDLAVLAVKVSKLEAYTPPDVTVETGAETKMSDRSDKGTVNFVGAHFSETASGPAVVLYLDFTNTGNAAAAPSLDEFYVYLNDAWLDGALAEPEDLDPAALPIDGVSDPENTDAGQTRLYYCAFQLNGLEPSDGATLSFERHNDDFQPTYRFALPVTAGWGTN